MSCNDCTLHTVCMYSSTVIRTTVNSGIFSSAQKRLVISPFFYCSILFELRWIWSCAHVTFSWFLCCCLNRIYYSTCSVSICNVALQTQTEPVCCCYGSYFSAVVLYAFFIESCFFAFSFIFPSFFLVMLSGRTGEWKQYTRCDNVAVHSEQEHGTRQDREIVKIVSISWCVFCSLLLLLGMCAGEHTFLSTVGFFCVYTNRVERYTEENASPSPHAHTHP